MPSDAEQLQHVVSSQQRRDLAPNVSSQVVSELKDSLLFQFNWEELLQAAPTAIHCMGACFVASSSPRAVVELSPPAKGFQYLRYSSVQANLVECGNLGRYAFIEAESGMNVVQMTSRVIFSKINDIIQCLGDPASAQRMLRPQLSALKTGAQRCHHAALGMHDKFDVWLLYVSEIHAACVEQESSTRDQLQQNAVDLAAEETKLGFQQTTVEEAQKASDTLKKQVEEAGEAFKKASDGFPSGWDLLGQQIVGDLANSVTTALSGAMSIMTGGGIFSHARKHSSPAGSTNPSTNGAPLSAPADPAYAYVQRIMSFLATVKVIVDGKDDNVDWERAKDSGTDTTESIKYLAKVLAQAKKNFNSVATTAEPSITLKTILDVTSQVAAEISAEVDKSSDISYKWPAKDSDQVRKWRSDFAAQYDKAITLAATAQSLPGSPANQVPLMANNNTEGQTAPINANLTHSQAVLEASKNRLATTQKHLTDAQANYVKTTELLTQQRNKLGKTQAKLARLTASNVSLAEIKSILIECIKLIINLKQQIVNLVRFFNGISTAIDIAVESHIEPFLETVKSIVAADGTDPNKDFRIGNFTLTDLQRSQVYSTAVILRSYFGVFGDVAKMWMQLSNSSVMPGLRVCDDMSVTNDADADPQQMQAKLRDLERWSSEASETVAKIAREKQEEIMGGMEDRIEEIKRTTAPLDAPPASTRKAITDGTEASKQAAQKLIEDREEKDAYSRFAGIDDDL